MPSADRPREGIAPYRVYLSDVSYFSGKLEACLRYKEIPFRRFEINFLTMFDEVLPGTGYMKVPAVQAADGCWLHDTTPMIAWFDRQYPASPVIPGEPASRFMSLLIEDYCDEWQWRPAMYWRWAFAETRRHLTVRLGEELTRGTPVPASLFGRWFAARQYREFVRGDGVTPQNRHVLEADYRRQLDLLSDLLADRPFLLGPRPSLVDFAWFGPMFRHYALDPAPARIMRDTAPAVFEWVARLWNARASQYDQQQPLLNFSDPGWTPMFGAIREEYLRYLDANAQAFGCGASHFDFQYGNNEWPKLPVVRYRVWCRSRLLAEWKTLSPSQQQLVRESMQMPAEMDWFSRAIDIDSGLGGPMQLPLQESFDVRGPWRRLMLRMKGTPWDRYDA